MKPKTDTHTSLKPKTDNKRNFRPEIEEIKARCEAATEGPWSYDVDEHEVHSDVMQDNGGDPYHICEILSTKRADANFVSNARQDIPDLLKYIEELTKEIERLKQCCKDFEFVLEGSKAVKQSDEMLEKREDALMRALDWEK